MDRMSVRDSPRARGERRARLLRTRVCGDLVNGRRAAGLSMAEVAEAAGVSVDTIRRLERADSGACTLDLLSRVAEAVGLQLAASLHPNGDPVRDRGQLDLIDRLRKRLGPATRLRTEVPVPIAGDLRAGDAMLEVAGTDGFVDVLIEAETHLVDIQQVARKGA